MWKAVGVLMWQNRVAGNVLADRGEGRRTACVHESSSGLGGESVLLKPNKLAASTARFYRPELDVLRFGAFFLVLMHHTMPSELAGYHSWSSSPLVRLLLYRVQLAGGFGLSLFFCLSAYLIATLLLRERALTGDVHLKDFYVRRILRIWPLYFSALILGFLRSYTVHMHPNSVAFLSYVFLMGSWYCAFYAIPANPIAPLWSISVEEQFYLFIPLTAKHGGPRTLGILAATLFVLCLIALSVLVHHRASPDSVWFNSFVQFSAFAAGLTLAVWLRRPRWVSSRTVQAVIGVTAVLLLMCGSVIFNIKGFTATTWVDLVAGYTIVSLGSAICVFAFIARPWSPPSFLVYLGKVSYGLYVFHSWTLSISDRIVSWLHPSTSHNSIPYVGSRIAISFLLSLLIASISYRFLESPFLRFKDRFTRVHGRPV
jgi:peptidoglycan/LPS O-acetylase OafA/YrhL